MTFAERLSNLMQRDGITKYRLSKLAGCSATTVANWLSGKEVTQYYLQKLSEIFSVSVGYLLGLNDDTLVFGPEIEKAIEKASIQLNVPKDELKNVFLSGTKKPSSENATLTEESILKFFSSIYDKEENKKTATNDGDGNNAIHSNLIPFSPTGNIPILGQIPAGLAVLAVEDIEGYLAVNVHDPEECFALRVKGDSMINAGICNGDLVVIRMQSCADNGQIVACRINGDEATLKRFKQHGDTVVLLPENPRYDPIIVPCSDFETGYASIIGVALQVVRML